MNYIDIKERSFQNSVLIF